MSLLRVVALILLGWAGVVAQGLDLNKVEQVPANHVPARLPRRICAN